MKNNLKIKIAMVDFWDDIPPHEVERYLSLFKRDYEIELDEKKPDIVIYSCFGEKHLLYPLSVPRIFFCGENVVPDFNVCDYAISSVKIEYGCRHLWIPQAFYESDYKINDKCIDSSAEFLKRKFCSFIYSQDKMGNGARLRRSFCEKLMKQYKHVDCPGKILHNIDSLILSARNDSQTWHKSKLEFLRNYKFNIAFENSEAPGYITEKLVDCYMANTVPIYWGSGGDVFPYPKESMICANDYANEDDLIARIEEVDKDDEQYLSILKANPFRKENRTSLPDFKNQICDFIKKILDSRGRTLFFKSSQTDAHRCSTYSCKLKQPHYKFIQNMELLLKKIYWGLQRINLTKKADTASEKSSE